MQMKKLAAILFRTKFENHSSTIRDRYVGAGVQMKQTLPQQGKTEIFNENKLNSKNIT